MTQVTVRQIEESWVAKAKADAATRGVSMNSVLRDAIARGLGVSREIKSNGLEKFAGSLPFDSPDEEKQWNEAMKVFDVIDENLWK